MKFYLSDIYTVSRQYLSRLSLAVATSPVLLFSPMSVEASTPATGEAANIAHDARTPAFTPASLDQRPGHASPPLAIKTWHSIHYGWDDYEYDRQRVEYTVLNDAGRDALSTLEFFHYKNAAFAIERARVIDPDGRETPIADAMFKQEPVSTDAARHAGQIRTTVTLPDLRIGSKVALTTRWKTPQSMPGQFHRTFAPETTAGRQDVYELAISGPARLHWKGINLDRYNVNLSKGAVPSFSAKPRVVRYFDSSQLSVRLITPRPENATAVPQLDIADTFDTNRLFLWAALHIGTVAGSALPPHAAALVRQINAQNLSTDDRITRIMAYVRNEYHLDRDARLTDNNFRPVALATLETQRHGGGKDLATLMSAMLRAAGLNDANVALIQRGHEIPASLIDGPGQVNHALVHVRVNGQSRWLDPQGRVFTPDRVPADFEQRYAFVLEPDGPTTRFWMTYAG